MENFTEITNFIKSILIVTLSEEIGQDKNGKPLPSEKHLKDVNNVIKSAIIDDFNEKDDLANNNDDDNDEKLS